VSGRIGNENLKNILIKAENSKTPETVQPPKTGMAGGAQKFVDNLRNRLHPRHTGLSVLFKYFYQAGYEWLGEEMMYGPHEVVLSALRGASRAYENKNYGAHIAIQWSTTPHDTEQRYRRYFLPQYICYMHGVEEINTEDVLWRMERQLFDHERFSPACVRHREIQEGFYHYIKTHSRRGKMHVPTGFFSGQYDAWHGWRGVAPWGDFGPPEESWDRFPCPNEPQGFFSGTPYGPVDILPIEADCELINQYKFMAFLGWNTADESQIDKLIDYVKNGGILLLSWPHLSGTVNRAEAFGENPQILKNECIDKLIGAELDGFIQTATEDDSHAWVGKIRLKSATALIGNSDGVPLVIENKLGNGKVILVNLKAYPSENSVKRIYTKLLNELGKLILEKEKGKGWLECSPEVGFTVYELEKENLRVIYFLNIDWWNEENLTHDAFFLWGDRKIKLDVSRDVMHILTISENWAVWTYDRETEVLNIDESKDQVIIRLQGMGKTCLTLFNRVHGKSKIYLKATGATAEPVSGSENEWKLNIELNGLATIRAERVPF
jgi:hypothetical protein